MVLFCLPAALCRPPAPNSSATRPTWSGRILSTMLGTLHRRITALSGVLALGASLLFVVGTSADAATLAASRPSIYPGGGVYAFGDAGVTMSNLAGAQSPSYTFNSLIVGMAPTGAGSGYWLVGADGGVYNFGTAGFFGSVGNLTLNAPIVGMAATPDALGYWLVGQDGGIFAFGAAHFYGSRGATPLNEPIVSMTATPDGRGYWMVADDGGIFAFGDAQFYGSTRGPHFAANI